MKRFFLCMFFLAACFEVGLGAAKSQPGYRLKPIERLGDVVSFTYAGNHKLAVYIPSAEKKKLYSKSVNKGSSTFRSEQRSYPVVVFNYDELVDKLGEPFAAKRGYEINRFVRYFAKKGYATVVPLERYNSNYSVQAALKYIETNPGLDQHDIHLFGHSSGAFFGLLAAEKFPHVKSIFLIAPYAPNDTGFYSTVQLNRIVKRLAHIPMVYIESDLMDKNHLKSALKIKEILAKNVRLVVFRSYGYELKYFWNPYNKFMDDFWKVVKLKVKNDTNKTRDHFKKKSNEIKRKQLNFSNKDRS